MWTPAPVTDQYFPSRINLARLLDFIGRSHTTFAVTLSLDLARAGRCTTQNVARITRARLLELVKPYGIDRLEYLQKNASIAPLCRERWGHGSQKRGCKTSAWHEHLEADSKTSLHILTFRSPG